MQTAAFTLDGIPFRPLIEQVVSRLLLRSPDPATRMAGRILLVLSTGEILQLAVQDLAAA